jgi:TRAP-type uncharacterized transport system substrate-binding protein
MRLRIFLTACALLLAAVALAAGIVHFALRPTELKVAVPATDPVDQRIFGLAADLLRSQRAPVRIEMVPVESIKAAMDALENRTVHLAVARSDAAMQGRTHTVMIMRREVAVLVAPKTGKMQKVTDLANATIGVTRDGPLDGSLLAPVLDYYGLARDKTKYISLKADDVADSFRLKKIDAMIVVGPVTSKQVGEAVADAARGLKGAIQFIDIGEADAIVKRLPALESIEIEQGTFGGRPPRPAESFNTLGYSIRLVATPKIDTDTVAELMRQLYLLRQNLAAAVPGAGLMEAPDTDEMTAFLIHPGVRAYVNGEQKSWFDRYSDWIYLGLFLASGVGSVIAGMFSVMRGKGKADPVEPARRIEAMLDRVRTAASTDELRALEAEADAVFRVVFGMGVAGDIQPAGIASFDMALRELRSRIVARRQALAPG